jgi:hypothetical protein
MKYDVYNVQDIFLEKVQVDEKLCSSKVVKYNWRPNYRSLVVKMEMKQKLKSAKDH